MHVRLLREAGGLGDVIRCLGVARAIRRARPDAEVWFYCLRGYEGVCNLAPDVARVIPVPITRRRRRDELPDDRRHGYLRTHGRRFDATVDLYCPAYVHERERRGRVLLDRIDVWTAQAAHATGLDLSPEIAWLPLAERLRGRAEGWLEGRGIAPRAAGRTRPLVGVEPRSVAKQRSFTDDQVRALVGALIEAGATPLLFGSRWEPAGRLARELGVQAAVGVSLPLLLGLVAELDVLAGVDSGLYHVAAVYGVPAVGVFAATSGRIIRRHYPGHVALDVGPAERDGLDCRWPCYGQTSAGHGRRCRDEGCLALARVPGGLIADAAMRCYAPHRRSVRGALT